MSLFQAESQTYTDDIITFEQPDVCLPPRRLYIELPLGVCFSFYPETSVCAALGNVAQNAV